MPRIFAVQLKDEPAERYEQWVNTPVYTHDYEDCVGWLGCELPEGGHSCEFAELAGDGAVTCASSSKVNRLRSENAKLREQVTQLRDDWESERDYADQMEAKEKRAAAENAKLRELVSDMWNGMCGYSHDCRSCEHYELYEGQRFVGECEYHNRMRELGIEGD